MTFDTEQRVRDPHNLNRPLTGPSEARLDLHIFRCFSKKLFHTEIEIQSDLIGDDKTVFKKERDAYRKAKGVAGGIYKTSSHRTPTSKGLSKANIETNAYRSRRMTQQDRVSLISFRNDLISYHLTYGSCFFQKTPNDCAAKTYHRDRLPPF